MSYPHRSSPRITYDKPTVTVAIEDRGVNITSTDGATGKYLSDFTLPPTEARRMGQALIDFADAIEKEVSDEGA